MPIPDSGEISARDINESLGRDLDSTLDFDQISRTFFKLDAPHSFTEFYGRASSATQASTLQITSTNPVTVGASGGTITVSYASNGSFSISAPNTYASTSTTVGSGNGSFTVTLTPQLLDAAARQALVYLTTTGGNDATLTINQSANDATISIVPWTGNMTFPSDGGEDVVYKIETAPDGEIEWTAEMTNATYFSHRINNTGTYTTNALSGTGDAFIEIKGEPNTSETTAQTATITVTATNLEEGGNNGPVNDTVSILPVADISFSPPSFTFASSDYASSNGLGLAPTGNSEIVEISAGSAFYSISLVRITGTNASDFQLIYKSAINSYTNDYYIFPLSQNTSTTTDRIAKLEVTLNNGTVDDSFDLTQRRLSVQVPIVSISPSSFTFDDTILTPQTVTGTIESSGNGTISSVNFRLEDGPGSSFQLVDRFSDDDGIVVDSDGFLGTNSSPGSKTVFTIGLEPDSTNTTGAAITDRIRFYASNQGGTGYSDWIDITQNARTFEFSDAGVTGFSVDRNTGLVTAPSAAAGITITNRSYSTGYSNGFYPLVSSTTTRSVTVTVQVPSGYTNSGGTVSDTISTSQLSAQEFILLNNGASSVSMNGDGDEITIQVDTQDVYNTTWTPSISYQNGSQWISRVVASTARGDGTVAVAGSANWPGLTDYRSPSRTAVLRVEKNASVYDEISIIQTTGTPPVNKPTISSYTPSGDITFSESNFGNASSITFSVTRGTTTSTNNITPTSVSFYMASTDFAFYQTDNNVSVQDMGGIWTTSVTYPAQSTFSVGIYPVSSNGTPTTKTAEVTFTMSNGAGSVSLTKNVSQSGQVIWSLGTIGQFARSSNDIENLSQEFQTNIPYTFDYMYSSFNRTQFGFYIVPGTSQTSRGTSATIRNLTNGQKTFTINNGAVYQTGETVSILQSVGTATTYGIGTVVGQSGTTLTVNITSGSGLTSTNYSSWEINQISADSLYTPYMYTRKTNTGNTITSTIRIDDTDNAYSLSPLTTNITQQPAELTGDIYVNSTNIGSVDDFLYKTYTSTYSNGYPSPTYYIVAIQTNYASGFTATITAGSSYAGLDTTFDSSGNGSGLNSINGQTRTDTNTIFYINLASNTTTSARTVEVNISCDDAFGNADLVITVNGTGGGPGGGGSTKPGPTA